MRAVIVQFLAVLLLTVSAPLCGQEPIAKPLKVLFVGNSYTYTNDLPSMVVELAEAAGGRQLEVEGHLIGGCTLERHVKETDALKKIHADKWDRVVLQEHSLRPIIDRDRMFEYARVLVGELEKQGSTATFYLTWARQHVPEMQAGGNAAPSSEYARAMFRLSGAAQGTDCEAWCLQHKVGLEGGLNGAYYDIAEQLGANVAPVGVAWRKALMADPPFVLHSGDKSHPNSTGTYLAACVFYASLLEQNPVGLPSELKRGHVVLINIPQEQAERLQAIAWESVHEMAKPLLQTR